MVFFLMPLYTRVLTTADYGVMDIVVNTSNMLLPLVMVSISDGVIRFGLDRSAKKADVFSIGLATSVGGFLVFLCFYPLMAKISFTAQYTWLIYLYLFAASMQSVSAQFIRAMGLVRLYAFNGIFNTLCTILCNVLFLLVLKWGIVGYVLSVIVANLLSMAFLWWAGRLWKFVKLRGISKGTAKAMLIYSIPLIPATIMWSVTNVSDRFLVTYYLGEAVNGLYSVGYKLPTVISLISSIFTQAWQLSAIAESEGQDRDRFYSDIFKSYQTVVFLAAGGILLFIKPITRILVSPAFFDSWQFAPFLVLSVVFSCYSSFYSSFYMATKKNVMAMVTTFIGAAMNVGLNIWLIPLYGAQGAAFATFVSYLTVFLIRAVDTRRLVALEMDLFRFMGNFILLLAMALLLLRDPPLLPWFELGLLVVMGLLNLKSIYFVLQTFLGGYLKKRKKGGTPAC